MAAANKSPATGGASAPDKMIAVLVISEAGLMLAKQLEAQSDAFQTYVLDKVGAENYRSFPRVGEAVAGLFGQVDGFVFIMAAGIATRTLAPHLKSKLTDPGAVVIDEAGEYVISLVGGHEGGANTLADRVAAIIGGQAVITTGSEVLKRQPAATFSDKLCIGVGCRRGTHAADIKAAIIDALGTIQASITDVSCLATIDEKRTEAGLLEAARELDLPVRFFSAAELQANGGWTEVSDAAERAFGVGGVCEPAALLGIEPNSGFVSTKTKRKGVTTAVAKSNARKSKGSIFLVGIGQSDGQITEAAVEAIENATDIVGYKTYTKAIRRLIGDKTVHESGMGRELDRARLAVRLACEGRAVAVISSGDSGIYGMAGPILEIIGNEQPEIDLRIIPGVTAAGAAAAAVGAPLMNDFAVISLSDLLTPWPVIVQRLEAAAAADLVIALYNPKSRGRQNQLSEAVRLIKEHRSGDTPAAVVRNAGSNPEICLTNLDNLTDAPADMRSTVIIGNSQSEIINGWFVTKRGYEI